MFGLLTMASRITSTLLPWKTTTCAPGAMAIAISMSSDASRPLPPSSAASGVGVVPLGVPATLIVGVATPARPVLVM